MRPRLAMMLLALPAMPAAAQRATPRTWINPVDIDYRYNFEQLNQGISYRSGADPVIVVHGGQYYLFETLAGGWWRSADLVTWHFVRPDKWPMEDIVAPAAWVFGDTLLLMQSSFDQRPILYTTTPATGHLDFYNRWMPPLPGGAGGPPGIETRGPWDPALFRDDDTGRWFMYWGSSNFFPLYGIELDPAKRLTYKGDTTPLFRLDPARHGWERFGRDHRDTIAPYMEGAWMTKHRGRYYLQYGAPGTEYNVYANGTYVGDAPLGPFTYAPYNPVSYRPGGFATGAGHGNTFRDVHGNWWNTGTTWIGHNWNFERRIVMYPAGFDADGQMYATTRFGDFPQWAPTKQMTRRDELFTGWMLLSYRKPVVASSTRDSFPASHVADENPRTFWVADANRAGETLTMDLGGAREIRAVQVNYADYRQDLYATDSTVYTQFRLHVSADGRTWTTVADLSPAERRDRPNAYVELEAPARARYVRYEHLYTAGPHLAISDMRVFGNAAGRPPATPGGLAARRDRDPRNAFVTWRPVAGAVGYNVLWGIAPGKLYQAYQVWADAPPSLEIRALNVGQPYWFAIESFDERGVSAPSRAIGVP